MRQTPAAGRTAGLTPRHDEGESAGRVDAVARRVNPAPGRLPRHPPTGDIWYVAIYKNEPYRIACVAAH
jgi:hypothetical protein